MCVMCAKILTKLVKRGLVSEGNVTEQFREIKAEEDKFLSEQMSKLSPKETEEFMKVVGKGQIH